MAASSTRRATPTPGNRRQRLASFEAARKKEQRRRSLRLLAICLVLALALLAYPLYLFVHDYRASSAKINEIGATVQAAGCDPVTKNMATGNQEHLPEGTKITYAQTPPDSGKHYPVPAEFSKRFYTVQDRPAVGTLVHNLEHGYTLLWYRAGTPANQVDQLQRIAKTFNDDAYHPQNKFIAAPWSEADGAGFPAGKNTVLARWYADPAKPTDTSLQLGVRQACTSVSGAAIQDFMARYPYTAAPEPDGA